MTAAHESMRMTNTKETNPGDMAKRDRIACSIDDACKISGLGRTTIYELIGRNELKSRRIGRRRLVLVSSLEGLFQ